MAAMAAILDFYSAKFYLHVPLIYKPLCCYNVSLNLIIQWFKIDFQDGGCGRHFGFPFHSILATFISTVALSYVSTSMADKFARCRK